MAYTEAELLRIRMDCLFTCEAGRMLYVNEPWRQTVPAPLLHAGRTLGGEICYRFGQQVSPGAMSGAQAMLESGVYRGSGRVNLIPFVIFRQTAIEVFRYGHVSYFLVNFVGNILIFLPLGLLPPLLWKKMERLWKAALLGCGVSVCIELTQLLLPRGTDIDDVWLNTLGAALGYGVFAILRGAAPNLLPRCRTAPAAERNCNG